MGYNLSLKLGPYDEDVLDALLDRIEGHCLVGSKTEWGSGQVTLTVDAESLTSAVARAGALVESVGNTKVRSCEAMTTEDFDMRVRAAQPHHS